MLQDRIRRWKTSRAGATAIEYAFLAAMIAMAVVVAVAGVGTKVNAFFTSLITPLA